MDALLNWLVQGALLALAAAAALALIPRSRPEARCAIAWTAYLGLAALPAVAPVLTLIHRIAPTAPLAEALAVPAPLVALPDLWWTPAALAGLWMAWFGAHLAALARAWASVRAARRRVSPCSPVLLMRLPHWSRMSAFGRRVRVVLSGDVPTAAVLGGGRPVIAIARRTIDDLHPGDLDRVLIHEWSHVQRRDDVAQWTQRVARAIAGWHPAAWWLERQIGAEREAACDQVAARVTGSAREYAACLATLASLDGCPVDPPAALPSRLRRRVERLVAVADVPAARPSRLPAFACATALVASTIAAGQVRLVVETMTRPLAMPAPTVAWTVKPRAIEVHVDSTPPLPIVGARDRQPAARATARPDVGRVTNEDMAEPTLADVPAEPLTLLPVAPRIVLAAAVVSESAGSRAQPVAGIPTAATQTPEADSPAPWTRVADAGVAIGHASKEVGVAIGGASKDAGLATAGFFSRLGKRIAGSF